jgi:hypothetical protein
LAFFSVSTGLYWGIRKGTEIGYTHTRYKRAIGDISTKEEPAARRL